MEAIDYVYLSGAVALLAIIGICLRIFQKRREAAQTTIPLVSAAVVSSEAVESTRSSSDGVKIVARATGTQREQRQEDVRIRQETELCLYCDARASHSTPTLRLVRPALDGLYRYLNIVPVNRWAIEIPLNSETILNLCEVHQSIARSHLEARITENQLAYAEFVQRQQRSMYEFERHARDEQMLDDANEIKRGKKQKKVADVAQIARPNLKVANGNGG